MKTIFFAVIFFPLLGLAALFDRSGKVISDRELQSASVNWQQPKQSSRRDLSGIVRIGSEIRYAGSGALIEPNGSNGSEPAYILTAAHVAIDSSKQNKFLRRDLISEPLPTEGFDSWSVEFGVFRSANASHSAAIEGYNVPVKRIVFAALNGIDIALLELGSSLNELKAMGFQPLKIASRIPHVGDSIRVIGIPGEIQVITESYGTLGENKSIEVYTKQFAPELISLPHSLEVFASVYDQMSGGPVLNNKNEIIGVIGVAGETTNYMQPATQLANLLEKGMFPERYVNRVRDVSRASAASCKALFSK